MAQPWSVLLIGENACILGRCLFWWSLGGHDREVSSASATVILSPKHP